MKLLGNAAVAMWWNVASENLSEFHEWHSKEHLPERMSIPGFRRGSRWQREDGNDFFVMYELDSYETLTSDGYLARLNDPTPWSSKMMPLHANMVRSQCRIVLSNGGGVATYVSTIRLSPEPGQDVQLEKNLKQALTDLLLQSSVTGTHLLRTETPKAALTKEQQIRGGDAVADWIVLVSGHDPRKLLEIGNGVLGEDALGAHGATRSEHGEPFRLVHVLTAQDV